MSEQVDRRTHLPEIEIHGSTYADTYVTVDGDPFPWPIHGVKWEMNLTYGFPTLTFSIDAKRILIEHTWPTGSDE